MALRHFSDSMLRARLSTPVDGSSLAVFRIAFGALMLWEVSRYFSYDWIQRYYITPAFHFTYYGFGWVRPWPGDGMLVHFYVLGALAVCIALGFAYGLASVLFIVAFTYVFLLEQARYLNHFYLISLLSGAMAVVPADAMLSVDAWRRGTTKTVPLWSLWLLRFHVAIPYVFGGIAKLNGDWLRGLPLRSWLAERTDPPIIGPWLTTEWLVWGGGPTINHYRLGTYSQTEAGVNAVLALVHTRGWVSEFRVGFLDSPEFRAGVGYACGRRKATPRRR
jgi:vitamin K-dependent gamma-carboxylase